MLDPNFITIGFVLSNSFPLSLLIFLSFTSNSFCTLLANFLKHDATDMIWLQHVPLANKLGLLQRFFIVAQGLEFSSEFIEVGLLSVLPL